MRSRDLEMLGDADAAMADEESGSEMSYDDGSVDLHFNEGHNNESDALAALREHEEHEKKYGHIKMLEVYEIDTSAALAKVQRAKPKPKVSNVMETTFAVEHFGENLGDEFESWQWQCPTVRKASTYKYEHVYKHGEGSPNNVKLTNSAEELGTGTALYFQLVKSMATCLFFMTLLSLPALVLFYEGSRVPESDRDALGLYMFSLGNLGSFNATQAEFAVAQNLTLSTFGNMEISMVAAAGTLTAMEVLQCLVFLITVYYINTKVRGFARRREYDDRAEVTLGDYTVVVRDLPPDATVGELIEHFSSKWRLSVADWKGRPPLFEATPVMHCDLNGQKETVGTWVAEVVIHRRIGHLLRGFRDKQALMKQLYRHRAEMKMYADDTPCGKGAQKAKYKEAEAAMLKVGGKIDRMTKEIAREMKKRNFKLRPKPKRKPVRVPVAVVPVEVDLEKGEGEGEGGKKDEGEGEGEKKEESDSSSSSDSDSSSDEDSSDDEATAASEATQKLEPKDPKEQIEQLDAVAAFVVFNYSESMARCVEDYRFYSSPLYSACYPEELLFKGARIRIEKAPEPFEVNFENLEIPASDKLWYQVRSNVAIFGIFILGLIFLLAGSTYQNIAADAVPTAEMCSVTIPTAFVQSSGVAVGGTVLRRPTDSQALDALGLSDETCGDAAGSGAVLAWYTDDVTDTSGVAGNYSTVVCDADAPFAHAGSCPLFGQERFCPCISTADASPACLSTECAGDVSNVGALAGCRSYGSGMIGNCYCAQMLDDLATGAVAFADVQADITGMCAEFYGQYATGQVLSYLAILAITLVNMLTRRLIPYMAKHEYHDSRDEEQSAVMLKTCVSMFCNLALIALFAYMRAPGLHSMLPEPFAGWGVWAGGYDDFEPAWYASIGSNLVLVFVLEAFVTMFEESYDYYVRKKCMRCCNYPQIEILNSHKVAMQHDLDGWEVGPYFSPTLNTAKLTALLFFTMMYAPGLPLLVPLCFLTFFMYFRSQKYLMLRYYMMPDPMGDGVMKYTLSLLPFAAMLRLAMACWMLSNPNILPMEEQRFEMYGYVPGRDTASSYSETLADQRSSQGGDVSTRLLRESVAPIFFLLLLVVVIKFVRDLWKQLPFYWTLYIMGAVYHMLCGKPKAVYADQFGYVRGYDLLMLEDELRQEMCPYTGGYFYFMMDKKAEAEGGYMGYCMNHPPTEEDIALSPEEEKDGWALMDLWDQYRARAKIFQKPTSVNGLPRPMGDSKRTYEIILEKNLNSYALDGIPAHRLTLVGLEDGTGQRMTYQATLRQAAHKHKPASAQHMLEALASREHIVSHYLANKTVIVKKKTVRNDVWKSDTHVELDLPDAYKEQVSDDEYSDDEHAGSVFAQRAPDDDYDPDAFHDDIDFG